MKSQLKHKEKVDAKKKKSAEYQREYDKRPERKAKILERRQRPENKAKALERNRTPEYKAKKREYYLRNKKLREEE